MNPLDVLRQRLGITEVSTLGIAAEESVSIPVSSSQGNVVGDMSCSSSDLLAVKQERYQQKMQRLQAGGDNADGLEEVRRLFRRSGRG